MKHSVRIIFGKEQVNKFILDVPLSEEEKSINEKEFVFKTQFEQDAFLKGIYLGVGWNEIFVIEPKLI